MSTLVQILRLKKSLAYILVRSRILEGLCVCRHNTVSAQNLSFLEGTERVVVKGEWNQYRRIIVSKKDSTWYHLRHCLNWNNKFCGLKWVPGSGNNHYITMLTNLFSEAMFVTKATKSRFFRKTFQKRRFFKKD